MRKMRAIFSIAAKKVDSPTTQEPTGPTIRGQLNERNGVQWDSFDRFFVGDDYPKYLMYLLSDWLQFSMFYCSLDTDGET